MKKYVFLLVCILLLPISVLAKTATKEDLLEVINNIQDVQVDEEIKILDIEVEENQFVMTLLENDLPEIRYIPYHFDHYTLTITGGYTQKGETLPNNNQYAFYIYSILESMSTAPYDEKNYYNNSFIQNEISQFSENNEKKEWKDYGKTFGLTIEKKPETFQIYYHYYLDGDDTIILYDSNELEGLQNPSTGNFSTMVTITLMIVIGLAAYTYWDTDKNKKRG